MRKLLFGFCIIFSYLSSNNSNAQQQYSANLVMRCNNTDKTGPSPAFLYTCDHEQPSCQAFLIFRTQPPYLSVSTIANLTSSDPKALSRINGIRNSSFLPHDKEVLVPVSCSCSGQYYQANTSYVSRPVDNTYFTIANDTYQGLTTCNALMRENPYGERDLLPGFVLRVPLRCACPTKEQIANGTKFLLTYLVTWKDTVPNISERFNVSSRSVATANGFSDEDAVLYPFTTILIPLPTEPSKSALRTYYPTPVSNPTVVRKSSHKGLYAGIGSGAALAVLCFGLFLGWFCYKRKRRDEENRQRQSKQKLPEDVLDKVVGIGEILKIYSFQELEEATDNFSPQKKLSDSVYRGFLRGKLTVIKKMGSDVSKEIKILGNINHFNLISLYGVCEHEGIFYLVYEYMEEGCLKEWLHKEDSSYAHSWNHRILIALDVANGLDYLHNFTTPAYVHKDINSSNILLNRDLRAKIANFSLARENGKAHTTFVVGERGYLAPEYVQEGKVSPKVDVYAFGVVLAQLITGKDAVFTQDGREFFLSDMIIRAMDGRNGGEDVSGLIDPRLQVKHPLGYIIDQTEIVPRMLNLSVACLARDPAKRQSMAEVVSSLMKIQSDVHYSQSFSIGIP